MILQAYSVFDTATGMFFAPMVLHNDQAAIRSCIVAMDDTILGQFPEQFTLFHVGQWDGNTGVFTPNEHRVVSNIASLVKKVIPEVNPVSQTLEFEE